MSSNAGWKKLRVVGAVFLLGIAVLAGTGWYKFRRSVDQPASITAEERSRFLYGSIGAEESAGVPYWIWLILPRMFPEYIRNTGGYLALGLSWEETREMPVGLSKKTVGYVRVAGNCALCHAYSKSNGIDFAPTVFAAGTGHTAEVQKVLKFYEDCARDPRFNAGNMMGEIEMWTKLSLLDRLIYRFILIPRTRERFLKHDPVIVSAAEWQHSQDPHKDGSFRQRLETLAGHLDGAEKAAVEAYLKSGSAAGSKP